MIIGVDARPLSYRLTGIGYYVRHLLETLQTMDRVNTYVLISNKRIDFECRNPKWCKVEGRIGKRFLSTLWMQLNGPYVARAYQLDLFWGPRHHLPMMLPRKIKTVLTIHDLVHQRYPKTMAFENYLVERLLMKRSISRADAVIAVSQATALDIRHFYKVPIEKMNTVYPGIPSFTYEHDSGGDVKQSTDCPSRYFLFVGTLEPRKNLISVLQAFEKIEPDKHDIHLMIVGNLGWQARQWLDNYARSKVRNRVVMTGYVSRQALRCIYENALCLLFPSLYEGFGMPLLEAMAAGIPIITSNFSSMAEVAGDAALLVDPCSISELAEAMEKMLSADDLRANLIRNGAKRLGQFSWVACAQKTMDIFERVYQN